MSHLSPHALNEPTTKSEYPRTVTPIAILSSLLSHLSPNSKYTATLGWVDNEEGECIAWWSCGIHGDGGSFYLLFLWTWEFLRLSWCPRRDLSQKFWVLLFPAHTQVWTFLSPRVSHRSQCPKERPNKMYNAIKMILSP